MNKKEFDQNILAYYLDGYKLAYSLLRHEANSQDALHSSIEKCYKKKEQLRDDGLFKSWFLTIVLNEARMILRQCKKIVQLDLSIVESKSINHPQDQSNHALDLDNYLSQIDKEDRLLLMMKYNLQMSFREISEITNDPESTVKSRIYRALKKLNQIATKGAPIHDYRKSTKDPSYPCS